jgi:hypothetical protein
MPNTRETLIRTAQEYGWILVPLDAAMAEHLLIFDRHSPLRQRIEVRFSSRGAVIGATRNDESAPKINKRDAVLGWLRPNPQMPAVEAPVAESDPVDELAEQVLEAIETGRTGKRQHRRTGRKMKTPRGTRRDRKQARGKSLERRRHAGKL